VGNVLDEQSDSVVLVVVKVATVVVSFTVMQEQTSPLEQCLQGKALFQCIRKI
jgi:hypothetical protein